MECDLTLPETWQTMNNPVRRHLKLRNVCRSRALYPAGGILPVEVCVLRLRPSGHRLQSQATGVIQTLNVHE